MVMKLAISKVKNKNKIKKANNIIKTWVFARTKNKRNENKIKTSVSN